MHSLKKTKASYSVAIEQAPALRHDGLEKLIQFALSEQNSVNHPKVVDPAAPIESSINNISNPALTQELVEKLSGFLRLECAERFPRSFGGSSTGTCATNSKPYVAYGRTDHRVTLHIREM